MNADDADFKLFDLIRVIRVHPPLKKLNRLS